MHQKRKSRSMHLWLAPFLLIYPQNAIDPIHLTRCIMRTRESRNFMENRWRDPVTKTHGQIWNDLAKRPQRLSSRCAFSEAMFQSFARLYAPSRSRLMAGRERGKERERERSGESGREIRDAKHEIYRKLERRATPVRVST